LLHSYKISFIFGIPKHNFQRLIYVSCFNKISVVMVQHTPE